jgi:hypothetical protein
MKNTILKTTGALALAILMLAAVSAILTAQNKNNETVPGENVKKLDGAWSVQSTGRNCQTGAPLATFPTMLTFNYGGTMQEFGTRNAPSLRGSGQGVWRQESGRNYTSAFQFFRFNADGSYAGKQVVRQEIELSDSGDEFTSSATAQVLDAGGNVIANNCSTGAGTRFE